MFFNFVSGFFNFLNSQPIFVSIVFIVVGLIAIFDLFYLFYKFVTEYGKLKGWI